MSSMWETYPASSQNPVILLHVLAPFSHLRVFTEIITVSSNLQTMIIIYYSEPSYKVLNNKIQFCEHRDKNMQSIIKKRTC